MGRLQGVRLQLLSDSHASCCPAGAHGWKDRVRYFTLALVLSLGRADVISHLGPGEVA
jgi:hypothetical protein